MAKICLDPSVPLPAFCALNIANLPAVDATHVDMSAVLAEFSALRREVHAMAELREEVKTLKGLLHGGCLMYPAGSCVKESTATTSTDEGTTRSFASTAQQLAGDAAAFTNVLRKPRQKPVKPTKLVVGKSAANQHVRSVATVRTVDIFVSRLHPTTTEDELAQCVDAMKGDIDVKQVAFNRLKSKYENLYVSYHVEILVDSAALGQAVDVFMAADKWPSGIFVKRFFKKRNGSVQE